MIKPGYDNQPNRVSVDSTMTDTLLGFMLRPTSGRSIG